MAAVEEKHLRRNKRMEKEQKEAEVWGGSSALCGNLVGGVQLAGGVMSPCGPTYTLLTSELLV